MISFKKRVFLIPGIFIVLSALNGCSSLGGPTHPPLEPPVHDPIQPEARAEKDRSFLYFYRVKRVPFSLGAVPIFVNDRLVARLKNNSHTWISVPVGTYSIRLKYGVRLPISESSELSSGNYYESEEVNMTAEKGHSYFFRAEAFFDHKIEYGLFPIVRFSFDSIPRHDALNEISGTLYFEPDKQKFEDDGSFNICRGLVGCE